MKDSKPILLLGAHMSVAGGYANSIVAAESIGCTTFQIFTKSNRQWAAKVIQPFEARAFTEALKHSALIKSVVAHAAYLANLASPDPAVFERSIKAISDELHRCDLLNIPLLIVHPGSSLAGSKEEGVKRVAQGLNHILESYEGRATIALETMAGQGSVVGSTFEELAAIRKSVTHKNKISVCFDTCHVLSAGYSFTTSTEYNSLWKTFDTIIGLEHLSVFHINDSKRECGSHIDRHEDIGKGKVGIEGFRLLMNDERFIAIPKILETPKESLSDDSRNMLTLTNLLSSRMKKIYGIQESS